MKKDYTLEEKIEIVRKALERSLAKTLYNSDKADYLGLTKETK
jgi:hypothetical protein